MLRNDLYKPWFVDDKWGFEILTGEFQEVVVEIENLEFANNEDGNLDVNYHVINKPSLLTDSDVKGDLFKSTFELIINDIVREAIETINEDNRNNDTEQSNL